MKVKALFLLMALIGNNAIADENVLRAKEAFKYIYDKTDDLILVRFFVEPGYDLYKHSLKLSDGVEFNYIPEGKNKNDSYFGDVSVLTGITDIEIKIKDKSLNNFEFRYQGCKPDVICYPEQRDIINIPQ